MLGAFLFGDLLRFDMQKDSAIIANNSVFNLSKKENMESQEYSISDTELRLRNFPISFYSVIMGLSGFTIALQKAEALFKFPLKTSGFLLYLVFALFMLITVVYTIKLIAFPEDVKKEASSPVKLSFFPTFSISLLLMSIAFLTINKVISQGMWFLGTGIHLTFTLLVISTWISSNKIEIQHFNAAWFIPVVGNMIVPIAGTEHFPGNDLSWFFFAIGIIFWIVLFTIFFYRIIFFTPLPERLIPTFFILIAPPTVGFIAYMKLNHEQLDSFAKVIYYFAVFLFILLLMQYKMFYKIKFYLSWWAYSFPLASLTIATFLMVKVTNGIFFFKAFALLLFILLTLIIIGLIARTALAIKAKAICAEDH